MTLPPLCEFRDPDGSTLLVRPLDEIRGRVIASNVVRKGELLFKDETPSWREAAEDLGGWTRLGPGILPGPGGEDALPDPEGILRSLDRLRGAPGAPGDPDPEGDDAQEVGLLEGEPLAGRPGRAPGRRGTGSPGTGVA